MNNKFYGRLLGLGLLLGVLAVGRVEGDAVEVIELGSNWSLSNQNSCKYSQNIWAKGDQKLEDCRLSQRFLLACQLHYRLR